MADYKVSARVEADTSRFRKQIEAAKRTVESLKRSGGDVEVTADISRLRASIERAKQMMRSFKNDKSKVNLDADASAATSKITRLKLMLKSIPNTIKSRIVVDMDKNQITQFNKEMQRIKGASDKFQGRMDSIANSIRSFGTVISNQIKGSLIASFSAAIPIIASLVPVIMAVGNATAVVGGGAIGLYGSYMLLQAGVYAFAGMAKTALKMLEEGTIASSKETKNYQSALNGLKSAWQSLVSSNAGAIFQTMANGLNAAKSAIQQLTPYFTGIANGMQTASQKLLTWVKSSDIAKQAFTAMNTTGVQVFNSMLSAVGRFGAGVVAIFTQFMPLFSWASQGFANMGKSFLQWATSVETNKGIQNFINYTKTNLPILGQIFGNVFMGLFNLFKAFGTNSQSIFVALEQMSAKFRAWSETIASSDGFKRFLDYVSQTAPKVLGLIGGLVMALVNFGIAMAPIGAAVLSVVTAFAQWIAKLFETNPAIARLLGIAITLGGILMAIIPTIVQLATAFTEVILPIMRLIQAGTLAAKIMQGLSIVFGLLTSPIALVIAAVVALAAVFIYLWNTNEAFRTSVIAIWQQIQTFISTVVQAVSAVVMAIWGALVAWWQQNNQLILQTIQTVWNLIGPIIMAAIQIVLGIVQTGWALIQTATAVAWNLIKGVVQVAMTLLGGIIRTVMQIINGDWAGAWNTIKATAIAIWNIIKSTAIAVWNALSTGLIAILNGLKATITGIWNAIKAVITTVMNVIKSVVTSIWNAIKAVVTSVLNGIRSVVISVWNAIKSAIQSAMNAIKSLIINAWNAIKSAIQTAVNTLKSVVQNGFNAIKSVVQNTIGQLPGIVRSKIGDMLSAGRSLIEGVLNGIKAKADAVIGFVKGLAGKIAGAFKGALSIHSPSRVMIGIAKYIPIGAAKGIERYGSTAIKEATTLAQGISNAFDPTVKTDFSTVGADLKNATASVGLQSSQSFNQSVNVPQSNVNITMDINNDALVAIVDEKHANEDNYNKFGA